MYCRLHGFRSFARSALARRATLLAGICTAAVPAMALFARFACFFGRKFVGMTALMGGVPAFAGNFALAFWIHGTKATSAAPALAALALVALTLIALALITLTLVAGIALLVPVRIAGSHLNTPLNGCYWLHEPPERTFEKFRVRLPEPSNAHAQGANPIPWETE